MFKSIIYLPYDNEPGVLVNDVFISYEHESKSIADNIVSVLENHKIRCWYAPRDVIGDYATSIVEAINSSKIFILILNGNASNSRHVLNEVEMAYKNETDITIVPFRVDNNTLSMAMEYYVKRLHWIDASNGPLDIAIDELLKKIAQLLGIDLTSKEKKDESVPAVERKQNKYFSSNDVKERHRLDVQQKLMRKFDIGTYDKIAKQLKNANVLDIGCNNGSVFMDRMGNRPEISKIIGVEYDEGAVNAANEKYGSDSRMFCKADLESPEFMDVIRDAMDKLGIPAFDFVHISMVLLHLKNPHRVIKKVRSLMAPGAVIMIKDIDDGMNLAYPDEDGAFERVYRICRENETSGYRHSGRQIYSFLKRGGIKDICLDVSGLNVIGMDYDERQALFDTYFSFIAEDLALMKEKYPTSERVDADYKWYNEIYDELEERMHNEEFFFSLGFMIFTGKS